MRNENKLRKGEAPKGVKKCVYCSKHIHPNYYHVWNYEDQYCSVYPVKQKQVTL